MDFHAFPHVRVFSVFTACRAGTNQGGKCLIIGLGQRLLRLVAVFPLTSSGFEASSKYQGKQRNA